MSVTLIGKQLYKSSNFNPASILARPKGKPEALALSTPEKITPDLGHSQHTAGASPKQTPTAPAPDSSLLKIYYINKKPISPRLYFQGCREDSQKLWEDYMTGQKSWSDMITEAHSRENSGRAAVLHRWNILPEGYHPRDNEDVVFRTGTDPATQVGRGEFSDEDLTANTLKAWHQLEESAPKNHFAIQHDEQAGFFSIPELNTLVWKPKEQVSPWDERRYFSYLKTISTHPEVIDPASSNPRFSMEYVLAMINKGQNGLCAPVEHWGNGYQRYETLIQLAKSTHHAMEKAGLAQRYPEAHTRLWDLCKMRKSPEELGIFKPGDSEATIIQGLKHEQATMQQLMAASFEQARHDLTPQIQEFTQSLKTHKQASRQHHYRTENPEDTYQRLCQIKLKLDILSQSQHHASFIKSLFRDTNGSRRRSFVEFQDDLTRQIKAVSKVDGNDLNLSRTPSLNWILFHAPQY